VLNAALQSSLQWRADAESLADQASRSLLDPVLFGNADEGALQGRLRDAGYADELGALFPYAGEPLALEHLADAIAQFERTLITPSAFDAFLMGDSTALSVRAQRGLDLFMSVGCADCHSGPGIGGQALAKLGVVEAYAAPFASESGRFEITHDDDDRAVFKVPTLRNVAQTAPYFHDGSVTGIEQAVRDMARLQLGRQLGQSEVRALSEFLNALSGAVPSWFAPPDE
jgi:cytochrome c peroxidase